MQYNLIESISFAESRKKVKACFKVNIRRVSGLNTAEIEFREENNALAVQKVSQNDTPSCFWKRSH
jgi:hypothetical protein